MWKFQPPSWKDSPTRYATRRKIPKVELRVYQGGWGVPVGLNLNCILVTKNANDCIVCGGATGAGLGQQRRLNANPVSARPR
jgi:hypothetical protein